VAGRCKENSKHSAERGPTDPPGHYGPADPARILLPAAHARRRIDANRPRPQERALVNEDTVAQTTLDETIDLWNKMWMADLVHDNQIVTNVRTSQARCGETCRALAELLERALRLHGETAPRAELSAALDEAASLRTECDRLRKLSAGMVPRPEFDAVSEEGVRLAAEVERLKRLLAASAPASDLDEASGGAGLICC
jgi:hypothetical protein